MKLRRHKNNTVFRIAFKTRFPAGNGATNGVVFAEGNSVGEVRRGFLAGRDRNNTTFNIRPA